MVLATEMKVINSDLIWRSGCMKINSFVGLWDYIHTENDNSFHTLHIVPLIYQVCVIVWKYVWSYFYSRKDSERVLHERVTRLSRSAFSNAAVWMHCEA